MTDTRLSATSFKVATYNVWFGQDGKGSPYPKERIEAVVELLKAQNTSDTTPSSTLLVCGFQEVLPELCDTVLQPMLEQAGYKIICQPGMHYKCAMAVHGSLEIVEQGWCDYEDTAQKRGFLYARFRPAKSEQQVLFTTTHLESPTDREGTTNTAARVNQNRALETFCNERIKDCPNLTAIISGDLNWDEQVRDFPLLSRGLETCWKDAWLETRSSQGFTFDCPLNPFLNGDRRARLDRILIRDGSFCQPHKTSLIGQDPLLWLTIQKDNVYEQPADRFSTPVKTTRNVAIVPSDHFGVVASLRSKDSD